jgi:uncharacterized protein (TIGR02453 family)
MATREAAPQPSFTPALFAFLRDLKRNNERGWFHANKARYEEAVREPALAFIAEFGSRVHSLSPHLVADPRPVGGSLFRIHRDTRFSKDKTPYKTHVGIQFRHELAKDVHAPGLYLHLEPGSVFAGGGIWHPDSDALARIRERIVAEPRAWQQAVGGRAFASGYRLGGDALKRAPAGFDREHPLIEDLRRKDFIAVTTLDERAVCEPGFPAEYARLCEPMVPLLRFLCGAVGAPF